MVVGEKFLGQQVGRRQGLLYRLVEDCARKAGPPYCFESLIWELELMAARRTLNGSEASPVEKVDRIWQLLTIHDKGRKQVAFGTLRNHLTTAKKNLLNEIHGIR